MNSKRDSSTAETGTGPQPAVQFCLRSCRPDRQGANPGPKNFLTPVKASSTLLVPWVRVCLRPDLTAQPSRSGRQSVLQKHVELATPLAFLIPGSQSKHGLDLQAYCFGPELIRRGAQAGVQVCLRGCRPDRHRQTLGPKFSWHFFWHLSWVLAGPGHQPAAQFCLRSCRPDRQGANPGPNATDTPPC